MTQDPFGNLREWSSVLELLADLKSAACLAECQRGIIRILRYRENWRLREEMLKQLWEEIWDAALRTRNLFLTHSFPENLRSLLLQAIRDHFWDEAVVIRRPMRIPPALLSQGFTNPA